MHHCFLYYSERKSFSTGRKFFDSSHRTEIQKGSNLCFQDKPQALAVSIPCLKLFQSLFKYRKVEKTTSKVDMVEGHFIETFLTLMLKLSLDDFKPIFYRLFNLSLGGNPIYSFNSGH